MVDAFSNLNINENNKDMIWRYILNHCGYNDEKNFRITCKQIKDSKKGWDKKWENENNSKRKSQFEPRLLCKIDTKEKRPLVFQEKGLFLISHDNKSYLIINTNIYKELNYEKSNEIKYIESHYNSPLLDLSGEQPLISFLEQNMFLRENIYLDQLGHKISLGRRRYKGSVKIGNEIEEFNIQYELDGCIESSNKTLIYEVKSSGKPESFNIRQLYFPYRAIYDIYQKNNIKKDIVCLFICEYKKIIHIWEYIFEDPRAFNSIVLKSYNCYKRKIINKN